MQAVALATRQQTRLRETARAYALQGLMIAIGPMMVAVGASLEPTPWLPPMIERSWWVMAVVATGVLVTIGGGMLLRWAATGRQLALFGLLAYAVVALPALLTDPSRLLLVLLVLGGLGQRFRAFRPGTDDIVPADPELLRHPRLFGSAAFTTSVVALAAWFMVIATGWGRSGIAQLSVLLVFAIAFGYTAVWTYRSWRRERRFGRATLLGLLPLLAGAFVTAPRPEVSLSLLAGFQAYAAILVQLRRRTPVTWLNGILEHPARLLVTTFAVIIAVGTGLLALPIAGARDPLPLVDAAFTAFSAGCITGLVVVDTPTAFSTFGHVVILVLVQASGLGIMTFSTVGVMLVGRRLGVRHETAVGDLLLYEGGGDLYGVARRVLLTTFGFEALGAAVLALLFRLEGDPLGWAVWRGVFTSISAFCNAGFALQSDSLVAYQQNPGILYTIAGLAILGGLGTPVIHAVPDLVRGRTVSLQAKLVLATSGALLAASLAMFAVFEWNHALAGLPWDDRFHNAVFLATAPRSVGFNAVDLAAVQPATVALTIVLMFIGGSPLSTAGGVKTTTLALLVAAVVASLRGRPEATAFRRRISHDSVYKATAIMSVATLVAFSAFVAIQLTQQLPFDIALFEVISALTTTGLSLGGTNSLDGVGKVIIMICMFVGRVGPLTLFLLLTERRPQPLWAFPEERVTVG